MINSFVTEVEGTSFEFITMNIQRLQLYQVYVQHEGQKARFHMQINAQGYFRITMMEACPEPYRHLESLLSAAILAQGPEKVA
ncbi:hypothetical protein [Mucilaginibacter lacusdianchii]|uniref:hypothetical protein n=1 Tax=Mucilaginibacter lacusdianchii TaxID=2684211 RepID=UPI00131E2CDC|nr:hypothetical protein [Mucilaginibacter sp. JXJ CY 39]